MNPKQQAAKTAINQLSIELITLVNQKTPITDFDVHDIRKLCDRISEEATALYR
jgi:hypothetical protein